MSLQAKPLRILVIGAHRLPGLGAVRSLGRAGYKVIAAYPEGLERPAGRWSRYWSDELRYPDARRHQFEFRDWLCDQAKSGAFDAVLPVPESCVFGVAALRQALPKEVLPILASDAALEYTLSKFHSTRLALALGIPCPATVFISDGAHAGAWNCDFSELRFPIIIKTDNYLTQGGSYESTRRFLAANPTQAQDILRRLEHIPTRVIAQERIPGEGIGAFFLRFGGKAHLRFAHRRLHEVPYNGGPSSFRESYHDDALLRHGEVILDAIGYEGVAMVEFRRGTLDGNPYFLEINGRLWGSLALALHAGIDFPRALIECYQHGRPLTEVSEYASGIKCRNIFPGELSHLLSILTARRAPEDEPPPSRLRAIATFLALSFNPRIRHDYLWWTDPLPGIAQAARTVSWATQRILTKGRRSLHRRRDDRLLEKLRADHRMRCKQPKYFPHSLKSILFVCYGNICRSPFAATYWNARGKGRSTGWPVAVSAGFHPQTARNTPAWITTLASEFGVDLSHHHSQVINESDAHSADAIFIMDRRNFAALTCQFPWAEPKTYFLGLFADDDRIEIDDPYSLSAEEARLRFQQLVLSLDGLMQRIIDA
jgi:protein-tyrosine-phosphatase/predicted ATP-grasp superfamily ATP-dependent carboligase